MSKIIQNLANRVDFSKEPYMIPFNDIIENNVRQLTEFLDKISVEKELFFLLTGAGGTREQGFVGTAFFIREE